VALLVALVAGTPRCRIRVGGDGVEGCGVGRRGCIGGEIADECLVMATQAVEARVEVESRSSKVRVEVAVRAQNLERAMLAEYRADYESWIVDVLNEALDLGATIPKSVGTLLEGRNVSQLRALSSVLKEVEEQIGR
jgi:hypothetical protein